VRENLAADRAIALASLAVAGWMRYAAGQDEQGRPIKVSDPLAPRFATIAAAHRNDPEGLARGFLSLTEVFDDDLGNEPRFSAPVVRWLKRLHQDGAARTVAYAVNG
jgi:fructuronate reductase